MRTLLALTAVALCSTTLASAAQPVEADELLALPDALAGSLEGLVSRDALATVERYGPGLAGDDFGGARALAPFSDTSSSSAPGFPSRALPFLPIPLLPDGALLFGFATREDVAPLLGDFLFPRPATTAMPGARATPILAPPVSPLWAPAQPDAVATPAPAAASAPSNGGNLATRAQAAIEAAPVHPLATVAVAGGTAATLLGLLGFALYHRIRANATLENDTRKSIFDAVCHNPGLGVHGIAKIAGVSYSTATYHLERLVAAGMIVMTPDGNKLCYYKNGGAFTENERRILPILKNEEAAKLLEAILDTPGTYRAALAERLGVTATTINWHLRRLRDAGLVHENRQGRNAYLYANSEAIRTSVATLAVKLTEKDGLVSERLQRYAALTSADSGTVGSSA